MQRGQDSSRLTFSVAVQLEFQGLIFLLRQSSQCHFTLITLSLHLGLQWCRFCTRSLLGAPAVLRARPGSVAMSTWGGGRAGCLHQTEVEKEALHLQRPSSICVTTTLGVRHGFFNPHFPVEAKRGEKTCPGPPAGYGSRAGPGSLSLGSAAGQGWIWGSPKDACPPGIQRAAGVPAPLELR